MGRRALNGLAVVLLIVAGAAVLVLLRPGADHGAAPAAGRTVIVAKGGEPLPATPFYALRDCLGSPTTCQNGAEGIVLTYEMDGVTPGNAVAGTVLTDENCEPDRYGVSHCVNRIALAAGGELVVRHDHNMGNDPCLAPGEKVVVKPV